MNDYRNRLLAWKPGDTELRRDEILLAVGLQCRDMRFPLAEVLSWIGPPDKASGHAEQGHLVYFHSDSAQGERETEVAYLFDVEGGNVVNFGSIARFRDNAIRQDGKTGFNILDEMESFEEHAFRYSRMDL